MYAYVYDAIGRTIYWCEWEYSTRLLDVPHTSKICSWSAVPNPPTWNVVYVKG